MRGCYGGLNLTESTLGQLGLLHFIQPRFNSYTCVKPYYFLRNLEFNRQPETNAFDDSNLKDHIRSFSLPRP